MTKVLVTQSKLDTLAEIVGGKTNTNVPLTLDEMITAADSITSGGGGSPTLETVTKSYTPTESVQTETITASAGYDGIEEVDVTVDAITIAMFDHMSINGSYLTQNGQRKWKDAVVLNFENTGYFQVPSPVHNLDYVLYNAVPSGTTVTPSTSSQTIGGSNYMMEDAVTVNPIPSQYIIPSGTLSITANGIYDVTDYASASVNVSGSGGFTVDDIAMRTISGDISGNATTIGSYAFYSCISLITADFPSATSIGASAFASCYRLTTASFPNATTIGSYAFASCFALTTVSISNAISISGSAFAYCYSLITADFPSATDIGGYAFYNCFKLTTVSFPNATTISSYAFRYCSALTTADFPKATSIGNYAFASCISLATASFPSCTSIGNSAFAYCYNLLSLYLLGSSVPTLSGSSVFYSSPIGNYTTSTGGVYGSIFVPSSLYDSYITATNWSLFSSRIVSV